VNEWLQSGQAPKRDRVAKRGTLGAGLRKIERLPPHALDSYKPRTVGERIALRVWRIAAHGEDSEALAAMRFIADRTIGKAAAALPLERPLSERTGVIDVRIMPYSLPPAPLPLDMAREPEHEVLEARGGGGQNGGVDDSSG